MHAHQRQSLGVIFDFQCGLPIKIKQKLKEDQRFGFPKNQSYGLIWRVVSHGLRFGIPARFAGVLNTGKATALSL